MFLSFVLSMPEKASWNGKWSGEGIPYQIVRQIGTSKTAKAYGETLCNQQFFRYRWNDGWEALVKVRSVDAREARQIRRKADFCGYDWLVDSIIKHGEIKTPER